MLAAMKFLRLILSCICLLGLNMALRCAVHIGYDKFIITRAGFYGKVWYNEKYGNFYGNTFGGEFDFNRGGGGD